MLPVLTEIMSVTHGVETAQSLLGLIGGSRFGQSIAVLGIGPLGLCHLIKAKLLGAGKLIATDRFASRLRLAEAFGATLTMQVDDTEPEERIARAREHSDGIGPDIVLDCSGFPQTFVEAIRMVRVGGVVVEAGTFVDMGPVSINPNSDICTKNVSVIGVGGETCHVISAIDAADGRQPQAAALRAHRQPLACRSSALRKRSSWRKPTLP